MKKIFARLVLLSLIMLIPVYGCSNPDVEKYNKEQENRSNQKEQNNDNQGITTNNLSFVIVEYDGLPADLKAMANLEPKAGFTKVVHGKGDNKYVFISLGQKPTGGYDIKIESVEDVEGKISIIYSEIKPGEDDVVTQALTYPWKVVKINSPLEIGSIVKK